MYLFSEDVSSITSYRLKSGKYHLKRMLSRELSFNFQSNKYQTRLNVPEHTSEGVQPCHLVLLQKVEMSFLCLQRNFPVICDQLNFFYVLPLKIFKEFTREGLENRTDVFH